MTDIGNVKKSYGKQFIIAVANTTGDIIMKSLGLPPLTLIISAPINEDGEDLGIYSMFITDSDGRPIRLTYNIQKGNGINVDGDIVSFEIDDRYIKTDEDGLLYFDLGALVDSFTMTSSETISVNTQTLDRATSYSIGTIKIDNNTVKSNNGILYVETDNLIIGSDFNLGIVKSDNNTIDISDGKISVITENLTHASEKEYGVSICDGKTIVAKDGKYSVNTENLAISSKNASGISKPDNKTIKSENGVYRVDTENIQHASFKNYGTIRVDGISLTSENGIIEIPKYTEFLDKLEHLSSYIGDIGRTVSEIERKVKSMI